MHKPAEIHAEYFASVRSWTDADRRRLLELLKNLSDTEYKHFHEKLIPGEHSVLGIRMPALRLIAKQIIKGDALSFLNICARSCHEERMLEGMITGLVKTDYETSVALADRFLDAVTNWALCDCFAAGLSCAGRFAGPFFSHIETWLGSANLWHVRAALVVMLSWYAMPEYIEAVLSRCGSVSRKLPPFDGKYTPSYYVRMGQAWLVSVCYVKCHNEADAWLRSDACCLDDWTFNMSLQKIRESNRVCGTDKAEIARLIRR